MTDTLEKNLAKLANQIENQIRDMEQGIFVTDTPVMVDSLAYYLNKIQVCQQMAAKISEHLVESKQYQDHIADLEQKNRELTTELNIWKQSAPRVTIQDGTLTTYFTIPTRPCTITIKQ